MNKKLIASALSATILAPALLTAVPTLAAEPVVAQTDGTVRFTQNTKNIVPILPNGPRGDSQDVPVLIPNGEPNINASGYRILALPSFDFNIHEIGTRDETYKSLKELLFINQAKQTTSNKAGHLTSSLYDNTGVDSTNDSTYAQLYAVPHFAQIANYSGTPFQHYTLAVTMEDPFTSNATSHELTHSTIDFKSAKILNNELEINPDNLLFSTFDTEQNLGAGDTITVLEYDSGTKELLNDENGTITSVVFDSNYEAPGFDTTTTAKETKLDTTSIKTFDSLTAKNVGANLSSFIEGGLNWTAIGAGGIDGVNPLLVAAIAGDSAVAALTYLPEWITTAQYPAAALYQNLGQRVNASIYGASADITTPGDDDATGDSLSTVDQKDSILAGENSVIGTIRQIATENPNDYLNDQVTLTVPQKDRARAERYSTSLTWTFSLTA
ncbi:MAG: WxL domain-containing protein [Lactobacillales bacterium]|jgi:hypothetical protein|nr:WxL domain-containing protein [Lactobacillales bacterium]